MFIKVIIAPLSTTTLTANNLIKLNLPRRLIFEGTLFGLFFFLNLYLFANMEEGKVIDSILTITFTATFLALIPLFLKLVQMIFHRAHRTSLGPLTQRFITSPPSPPPPLVEFPSPPPTTSPATLQRAARRTHSYNIALKGTPIICF